MEMWKKIMASLLGLVLVMTAMPLVAADIDGNKILEDNKTVTTYVNGEVMFTVNTNSLTVQDDTLYIFVDGKLMGTVDIPNDWGKKEFGYTLKQLEVASTNVKNAAGTYSSTINLVEDGMDNIIGTPDDQIRATGSVKIEVLQAYETPLYLGQIIDDVDYEDTVAPDSSLTLDISLENDLGVNFDDVTITAWISDASGDRLGDKVETTEFNLRDETTKDKSLTIEIPSDADEGDYYVIAQVESDEGFLDQYVGDLAIERNEDNLKIASVAFDSEAKAGDSIDFAVSVLNNGQNDESDVKVKVSIAALGLSQTSQAFEIQEDQTAERYFTFELPKDADADRYVVKVQASNENVDVTKAYELTISGTVKEQKNEEPELIVSADSEVKQLTSAGSVYAITVTNGGDAAQTFSLTVGGTEGWAESSVNPSTVTVAAGASKLVSVFVAPIQGATGTHQFSVYVKQDSTIVDSVALTAQVSAAGKAPITGFDIDKGLLLEGLRWIVAILIVAAIVLFVMWLWKKEAVRGSKKGEAEVYY